jgi:hypothetical protein
MSDASKCCVCGEQGHTGARCPELYAPLREGFYKGGGGGGGHSHDDDEKVDFMGSVYHQVAAANNEHEEDARCLTVLSAFPRSLPQQAKQFWAVDMPSTCCV